MKIVLTVIEGPHAGKVFEFDRHDTFIVGRAKTAQFRLSDDDEFFSRNHFLLEVNPPLCRIMDLSSTNGTRINGKKVQAADLKHGDIIRGGKTKLRVSIPPEFGNDLDVLNSVGDATMLPNHRQSSTDDRPERKLAGLTNSLEPTLIPRRNGHRQENKPASKTVEQPGKKSDEEPLLEFPGYRTLKFLGRGGMGVVYQAESIADGSLVAVKAVRPHIAAVPSDVSRFLREAMILKELTHPHIVRFRDMNQLKGSLFIVMDFIAGQNADAVLKAQDGPFPIHQAISVICQLLDALQYAHDKGYVHRDVKPTNLLISSDAQKSTAFLADFGLSRAYQSSKISGLTMTGDIGGSTPFMPPEQITRYRNVGFFEGFSGMLLI